jgi:hypothetical protein
MGRLHHGLNLNAFQPFASLPGTARLQNRGLTVCGYDRFELKFGAASQSEHSGFDAEKAWHYFSEAELPRPLDEYWMQLEQRINSEPHRAGTVLKSFENAVARQLGGSVQEASNSPEFKAWTYSYTDQEVAQIIRHALNEGDAEYLPDFLLQRAIIQSIRDGKPEVTEMLCQIDANTLLLPELNEWAVMIDLIELEEQSSSPNEVLLPLYRELKDVLLPPPDWDALLKRA